MPEFKLQCDLANGLIDATNESADCDQPVSNVEESLVVEPVNMGQEIDGSVADHEPEYIEYIDAKGWLNPSGQN